MLNIYYTVFNNKADYYIIHLLRQQLDMTKLFRIKYILPYKPTCLQKRITFSQKTNFLLSNYMPC